MKSLHQCCHCCAIHCSCQKPPPNSMVQTTTSDAIWRVELKCLKDGHSSRTLYIILSISCLKLTHVSFNFFIAHGKFNKNRQFCVQWKERTFCRRLTVHCTAFVIIGTVPSTHCTEQNSCTISSTVHYFTKRHVSI